MDRVGEGTRLEPEVGMHPEVVDTSQVHLVVVVLHIAVEVVRRIAVAVVHHRHRERRTLAEVVERRTLVGVVEHHMYQEGEHHSLP